MAARHLQKLRAQDVVPLNGVEDGSSDSEEESPGPLNPFDLLDDTEASHSETEQSTAPDAEVQEEQPKAESRGSAAKKKKKAKQKQKKANASTAVPGTASKGSKGAKHQPPPDAEDDIDQLLASLNITQTAAPEASTSGRSTAKSSYDGSAILVLLGVNPAKLKADDEMRRIFGSKVVDAEARNDHAGGMVGASRRVRRLIARGLIKRSVLKPGLLITPKEHWPPFEGGLSMELAGTTSDGYQLFRYTHSAAYHAVQMLFEQSQASFDPNTIMALLQQHPYHVDALLTMHELYRSMGEVAASDEMLERCIYALEMAWHPYFNPATANTRMDYGDLLSRPLFVALFKQTQNLSRRGLHGTALEYAKLLLGLDPGDPRGVLFCIDYLAIRAQQYTLFLKRLDELDDDLGRMPGFCYSVPLAEFRERTGHTADKQGKGSGFAPTAGPSNSSDEEAEGLPSLEKRLSHAVMLYPEVVVRLMDKLKDKGVGKDAEWGSLLEKPLLRYAGDADSAGLSHFVDIFVERHHLLWKAHDAQRLLKDACTLAVQASPEDQSNWACLSQELRADGEPYFDKCRHLRIADFSDTVSALPPEELQAAMGGGGMAGAGPAGMMGGDGQVPAHLMDAMQGVDEEMLADMVGNLPADQAAELQRLVQEGGIAPPAVGDEEMEAANPWTMLLRTFLPWVNAGQVPDYRNQEDRQEEDEHTEHAQQATEVTGHEADAAESDLSVPEDDDLD